MVYLQTMNILLTNDDGIFSPGLAAAARAAMEYGELYIAAPSVQKTASGRSLIGGKDEFFRKAEIKAGDRKLTAWHIDCTPALVIKMAFETVFRGIKFDLAVSGINYGENIGSDITISGTMGAAFEAASVGISAIAASLQTPISSHFDYTDENWDEAVHYLSFFIDKFRSNGRFNGFEILKLDVPASAGAAAVTREWEITRLTDRPYYRNVIEKSSPQSRVSDLRVKINNVEHSEGTDAHTINVKKKVSVTPVSLDFSAPSITSLF